MANDIKSASELGITQAEYDALLLAKDVLAAESMIFDMGTACGLPYDANDNPTPVPLCNTTLCIGGTMGLALCNNGTMPSAVTADMKDFANYYTCGADGGATEKPGFFAHSEALAHLFFDGDDRATHQDGITAIDNFLRGSTGPWDDYDYGHRDDASED